MPKGVRRDPRKFLSRFSIEAVVDPALLDRLAFAAEGFKFDLSPQPLMIWEQPPLSSERQPISTEPKLLELIKAIKNGWNGYERGLNLSVDGLTFEKINDTVELRLKFNAEAIRAFKRFKSHMDPYLRDADYEDCTTPTDSVPVLVLGKRKGFKTFIKEVPLSRSGVLEISRMKVVQQFVSVSGLIRAQRDIANVTAISAELLYFVDPFSCRPNRELVNAVA